MRAGDLKPHMVARRCSALFAAFVGVLQTDGYAALDMPVFRPA
jgi:hypothetical protein